MANTAPICTRPQHSRLQHRHMKKRRLSIQAIFAREVDPPKDGKFKTLPRSFAAHASPYYDVPPVAIATPDSEDSFLLDDDPFADLSGGPRAPLHAETPVPVPPHRYQQTRIHPRLRSLRPRTRPSPMAARPPTPAPPPPATRTVSHTHTTPAYQKPAFKPRPSLPSLHTLAKMSVVVPHKVRRGRVGAGLPFEPWDLDSEYSASPASTTAEAVPPFPFLHPHLIRISYPPRLCLCLYLYPLRRKTT
ncbi:hypothetical protein B0H13DRAFT_384549 [Mycena leptocephala]|nr:hypothetical protein B0H13DRAFT_384549 [Mycena leptocephala]